MIERSGHPDDKWGCAAQLALSFKNIPTGPGDTINMQAVYTDGATRYNIQDLAGGYGANTIYGGTNVPWSYQSVGFGVAPDSVFVLCNWQFSAAVDPDMGLPRWLYPQLESLLEQQHLRCLRRYHLQRHI